MHSHMHMNLHTHIQLHLHNAQCTRTLHMPLPSSHPHTHLCHKAGGAHQCVVGEPVRVPVYHRTKALCGSTKEGAPCHSMCGGWWPAGKLPKRSGSHPASSVTMMGLKGDPDDQISFEDISKACCFHIGGIVGVDLKRLGGGG